MDEIKRERRDWFYSNKAIFDLDFSLHAKIVYLFLCRCSDEDGKSFPSYSKIAEKCDISKPTAMKAIRELENSDILVKEKRENINGDQTSNLYTIKDKPQSSTFTTPVNHVYHPSKGGLPPQSTTFTTPVKEVYPKDYPIKDYPIKDTPPTPSQAREESSEIVDAFNSICVSLPSVKKVTPERKRKILKAAKEYDLIEIFKTVQKSRFLTGENDREWKADFDWIIKPANIVKIHEGRYNDRGKPKISGYEAIKALAGGAYQQDESEIIYAECFSTE